MDCFAQQLTTAMCEGLPADALLGCPPRTLEKFLPEVVRTERVEQRDGSVFAHTLHVLQHLAVRNPVTVWAGLFHDIGKGREHDRNHAEVSGDLADQRMRVLGFNDDLRQRVSRIVRTHMQDLREVCDSRSISRMISRIGFSNLDNWFVLRKADSTAYANRTSLALVNSVYRRIKETLTSVPEPTATSAGTTTITGVGRESGTLNLILPGSYRPDWDTWYMLLAYMVSTRSPDPSTQHGAIFADRSHRPLGFGYNGCPAGCDDDFILSQRPLKYFAVIHAEENAMLYAPRDLARSTLYVTGMPCSRCWSKIVAKEVSRVVYGTIPSRCIDEYDEQARALILRPQTGIEIVEWKPDLTAVSLLFQIITNKIKMGS